ncbi:MAG TPA: NAD(P)-dependent oxidoreductase [Gammaproteobacteria bacterium]|nr:NAD(P)-dependent oxidoreductase [Gammaproteobacteria bacterium]
MSRPLVVVYRSVTGAEESYDAIRSAGCKLIIDPIDVPGVVLSAAARRADALVGATFRGGIMDADWLDRFPRLRLIAKYTIGFDDVDLAAATARGIAVTHCPTEANWGGVAEGTMAMLLTALKRIRERDRAVRTGGWRDPGLEGRYVGARSDGYSGLVIGIVGLGRVGRRLAALLRPWRARVLACDPYVSAARFAQAGVQRCDLDSLLRRCDVVTLHCALTPETRGMIDERAIALMKPGALLVNTARGAIVDLAAVLAALATGELAQAALDVFPEEPPPDVALLRELGDKLLLSPHMVAANEGGTLLAAVPWVSESVIDALSGRFPERVVNPAVEVAWLERFADIPLLASASRAAGSPG